MNENQEPEGSAWQPLEQAPQSTLSATGAQTSETFVQTVQPTVVNTEPASTSQVAGTVNGQPLAPTTPLSSSQPEQTPVRKSWVWLPIFIACIALSVVFPIAALIFVVYTIIEKQWDRLFIALGILQIVILAAFAIAFFYALLLGPVLALIVLANLIGLPIYLRKHKPHGKELIFNITSLVISIILALIVVLAGAWVAYQKFVAAPNHASQKIAEEEAVSFMQDRKVDYFVGYTDIDLAKDSRGY